MEGRDLGAAAVAANPGGPAKYDKQRAGGALLAATQPAYATDADMLLGDDETNGAAPAAAPAAAEAATNGAAGAEKKTKKVRVCGLRAFAHRVIQGGWSRRIMQRHAMNQLAPSCMLAYLYWFEVGLAHGLHACRRSGQQMTLMALTRRQPRRSMLRMTRTVKRRRRKRRRASRASLVSQMRTRTRLWRSRRRKRRRRARMRHDASCSSAMRDPVLPRSTSCIYSVCSHRNHMFT